MTVGTHLNDVWKTFGRRLEFVWTIFATLMDDSPCTTWRPFFFVFFCPGSFWERGRGYFGSGYESRNKTALSTTVSYRGGVGRGRPAQRKIFHEFIYFMHFIYFIKFHSILCTLLFSLNFIKFHNISLLYYFP